MLEILSITVLLITFIFIAGFLLGKYLQSGDGNDTVFIIFSILAFFIFLAIVRGWYDTEKRYALELYEQSKPVTKYQSRLILGSDDYTNDKPIVLKNNR